MSLIRFPGLIDIHVHLRDPGATHKEDFTTGTRAAVSGGFTYVLDMPNNPVPTITPERLNEKINLSIKKAICDVEFHYGTDGNNLSTFAGIAKNPHVFGLKIYCNHTTGTLLIEDKTILDQIFSAWKYAKPILVHAEKTQLEYALYLAAKYKRRLHVCHISQAAEVKMVRRKKLGGMAVSAGVTPHHLFLTEIDLEKLGSFAVMKPPLGSKIDQDALWEGLLDGTIDLVESDHASHTIEEKQKEPPAFGVPGLETTLGLLLKAVHEDKLTLEHVKQFLYDRPKALFSIPDQQATYIEFDPEKPYTLKNENLNTKCGWSPFAGWELYGRVETLAIRNRNFIDNGRVFYA